VTQKPPRRRLEQPPDPSNDGEFIPVPGGKYKLMVVIPNSSRDDIKRAGVLLNTTNSSIVHQAVVWFLRHHPLLIMMRKEEEEEEKLRIDGALGTVQAMVSDARAGKQIAVDRLAELEDMLALASNLRREATS
jgi:hypothetical protein